MKLGIALIVIFGADFLIGIGYWIAGYLPGYFVGIRICFVDTLVMLYGISRIVKAKRKGITQC